MSQLLMSVISSFLVIWIFNICKSGCFILYLFQLENVSYKLLDLIKKYWKLEALRFLCQSFYHVESLYHWSLLEVCIIAHYWVETHGAIHKRRLILLHLSFGILCAKKEALCTENLFLHMLRVFSCDFLCDCSIS